MCLPRHQHYCRALKNKLRYSCNPQDIISKPETGAWEETFVQHQMSLMLRTKVTDKVSALEIVPRT